MLHLFAPVLVHACKVTLTGKLSDALQEEIAKNAFMDIPNGEMLSLRPYYQAKVQLNLGA